MNKINYQMSKQIILICILTVLHFSSCLERAKKCHVLALGGGGDGGAYQAGVMKGLVDNIPDKETKWEIITGISVGSLNAAGLSIFEIGKEDEAIDYLLSKWRTIKGKKDIFTSWWGGPLLGLFTKSSLYDSSPLRILLAAIIAENEFKRKCIIGTTNLETGGYDTFSHKNLNKTDYIDAILSSSAFPVMFPNIIFRNNTYIDGGVKMNIDIHSGINQCLDDGYEEKDITVDAISCNTKELARRDPKNLRPLSVLMRTIQIFSYDHDMRDLHDLKKYYPNVNFRYIITPTKSLPTGNIPLNFSGKEIEEMISKGIEDAKLAVEMGEGKNLAMMKEEYHAQRKKLFMLR